MNLRQRIANNIYLKLLVVLICIAILPLLVSSVLSFRVSIANAEKQSEKYSERLLEQIVASNDVTFEQMKSFIYEIMINFNSYSDVLKKIPYTSEFLEVSASLDKKRQAYQHHINNFAIIDLTSEHIISSVDGIAVYKLLDYKQQVDPSLIDIINAGDRKWRANDIFLRTSGDGEKVLTYIAQLGPPDRVKGYIALDIDPNLIKQRGWDDEYGSLYVTNSSGMLLNDRNIEKFEASRSPETSEHYMVISRTSNDSGLRYDYVIEKRSLTESNALLLKSILYIAFGLTVLGALAAWLSSKNIYTPLRNLLNYIRQLTGEASTTDSKGNEINFLERAFSRMNKERLEYANVIRSHQNVFKQRQLNALLTGNVHDFQTMEAPEHLRLKLMCERYSVIVIEVDDSPVFKNKYTPIEQQLMYYAMENITEEILSSHGVVYAAQMEPYRIIAMHQFASGEANEDQWIDACKQVVSQIDKFLHISVSVGISSSTNELRGIKECAEQAARSLAYTAYYGKNSVIHYPSVSQSVRSQGEPRPVVNWNEARERLKIAFRTSEREKIDASLTNLVKDVSYIGMTKGDIQYTWLQYVTCLSDICAEFSLQLTDLFGEEYYVRDHMARLSTVAELEWQMRRMADQLLEKLSEKKSNVHQEMINKLLIYINENIESNLTLEMIAEKAFMHPAYLSRICKSLTGMSLGEHIVMAKINRAKWLLEHANDKVGDIAERLGYTTPRAFYRIFKDYTGYTPSDYRKHIGLKNIQE